MRSNDGELLAHDVVIDAYGGLAFMLNSSRKARGGAVVSLQLFCGCSRGLWNYLMSYVLKEGDSVASLASRFGVSMDNIETVNGINIPDNVTVGELYYIPLNSDLNFQKLSNACFTEIIPLFAYALLKFDKHTFEKKPIQTNYISKNHPKTLSSSPKSEKQQASKCKNGPLSSSLLPKTRLYLLKTGLPKTTRCYSSSANGETMKSSHSKKSKTAKEQRAVAVESYVKDYMDTHPGVFPKALHVQKEVGRSWYSLKDILTSLKDKMLGNPQPQNHITRGTLDCPLDTRASDVTHDSQHNVNPETVAQFLESVSGSQSDEKIISVNTSDIMGENLEDVTTGSGSLVTKMHDSTNSYEISEPRSIVHTSEAVTDSLGEEKHISSGSASDIMEKTDRTISVSDSHVCNSDIFNFVEKKRIGQLSEAIMDSLNHEKSSSRSVHPCLMEENLSKDVDFPREISRSSELVEPDKGHMQPTEGVSESGHLVCLTSQLLNEASSKTLDENESNKLTSRESLDCRLDMEIATSGQIPHASSEVEEMPSSSGRAKKEIQLADMFTSSMNNRAGVETDKNDVLTSNRSLEFVNEPSGEDLGKSIKGLINCINELPKEGSISKSQENNITIKTNQVSTGGSIGITQSEASLHISERKEGRTSMKGHASSKDGQVNSKGSIRRELSQMGVRNSEKKVIQSSLKIPALSKESEKSNGSKEKPRTKVPFMKPLEKTVLMENCRDTTSSVEDTHNSSYIPDLIGDPDVPATLIKHPTRTVKIETLTNRISSRQLKEALALCGSGVASLFMGSSSSATYLEFETEDAKERAIAKHSLNILGEKLLIFRIDTPRTTVVRVSTTNMPKLEKFRSICNSYGQVLNVRQRSKDIVDVYFKYVELPNMVKILNKLNGLEIDGSKWLVQPAPVFPPEILKILWSRSDGRRQVKGIMHSTLQKLKENSACIAELTDLTAKYYGEELNEYRF